MEDTLREQPAPWGDDRRPDDDLPVSEAISRMAHDAVKDFPECFWWWNREMPIVTRGDVRAVVETLREGGGHRAWWAAQALYKCL